MPQVRVDLDIEADVDSVWETVCAVEAYPQYMENVRSLTVLRDDGTTRTTAWSVLLKGSILEWSETERIDHVRRRLEFNQLDGDLDRFDGFWQVTAREGGRTHVELDIVFEIGIPLLAQMLDPVAVRAIRDNSEQMLYGLERRAVAG
ncbi:SRPBCC family protein [Spirillospora sp. NPDC047279]|uniref:type II toxin-antitoxin system RatA family toxin n=1 Tax=Spirillospora sp. NPDC047279 TaxID=3155478 RepID=UPI00340BBA4F